MLIILIIYLILFTISLIIALSLCKISKLSDEEYQKIILNQLKDEE